MLRKIILFAVLYAGLVFSHAGGLTVPQFQKADLKFDGIPDESFWEKSGKITDFGKFRNHKAKTAGTEVRLCLDRENLYIGLICKEPAGIFRGNPAGSAWAGDNVEIFLASLENTDWYRQIVIGLNGKQYQEFIGGDQYQSKLNIGNNEWSAEIVVPLKYLGSFTADSLRFNMLRYRKNAREFSTWRDIFWAHDADKFGTLTIRSVADDISHGPWTFGITSNGAGVNWETAGVVPSAFSYRKKGETSFRKLKSTSSGKKLHSVFLKDLTPDTVYEYKLGNGKIYSFRTLSQKKADFSFTVTTDIHGRSASLKKIVTHPEVQKGDMIFLLGDLMSALIGRYSCYAGFLDTMVTYWKKTFYCIRGNHEYRGAGTDSFFQLFYPAERKSYGAFFHKGVFFILLDTDGDVKVEGPEYMENQKVWLKQIVKSKAFAVAEYRVLLTHKPLMLPAHGGGSELKQLFDILSDQEKERFDLSLAGHTHSYSKVMPGESTLYSVRKNRNGMSPVLKLAFPVLTNDLDGFFSVSKNSRELSVRVFDKDGKILDTIKIFRKPR